MLRQPDSAFPRQLTHLALQDAVACGYREITEANQSHTISIAGATADLRECFGAPGEPPSISAADPAFCMRCPTLLPNTRYIIHVVASRGPLGLPAALSAPLQLSTTTAMAISPPALLSAPFATDEGTDAFTVNFAADRDRGGVAYAVTYAHLSAPFFAEQSLRFPAAALTPAEIAAHARNAETAAAAGTGYVSGGVVAAGMRFAAAGGIMEAFRVAPRCSAAACAVQENRAGSMLAPATEYMLWAVAVRQGEGDTGSDLPTGVTLVDDTNGIEGAALKITIVLMNSSGLACVSSRRAWESHLRHEASCVNGRCCVDSLL